MSADPESKSLLQPPSAASDETAVAPEEKLQRVSRRGFLTGAGAAAVLMTAGPATALAEEHSHMAKEAPQSAKALALRAKAEAEWFEPFAEPSLMSLESTVPNSYDATLRVIMVPITFNDTLGKRTENVRTYNGEVPGPTFRVRAGEALNVKVINDLPKNTDQFCVQDHHASMNNPHCFNTTNLHVHGLHVSPKEPSDNVFVEIPPKADDPVKGEYKFCFQLPLFHKPGTHWYHAHKHGSTAIQLVNGMAGALIVEDPPDKPLVPKPFADIVMIIQEIVAKAEDVYSCQNPPSVLFYVNGRYRPTINVIAGEVYRWRFINATSTPRGFTPLELRDSGATKAPMGLIAVDGIYLPTRKDVSTWVIAPGNRADMLIRFSPGSFTFFKAKYATGGGSFPEQALAEVKATAPALKMAMAVAESMPPLPDYLKPFTDAEIKQALDAGKVRTVTFDVDSQTPCAGKFRVNGQPFDPNGPAIEVNLGDTELWTIKNNSGADHPFHIHVNPFQVIDNNGKLIPAGERYWQDTVIVPAKKSGVAGYVTFATRFLTFDGPFVLHCHILIHEDWGMMMKVTVKGNGYGPCVKVP
jgi:FtsP/CotA-like multicopper oxidase with cupredoxin domain